MSDPVDPTPARPDQPIDPAQADPTLPRAGEPAPQQPASRPRKRKWLRRTFWGMGTLLVLLVALVLLAPMLLSTGPGTNLVERIANGQVDGRLQMSGLSLGWTSGVSLDSLVVEDTEGRRVVEVAEFDTELGLWDAIRQRFDLGRTTGRVNLPLVLVYDDGTTNLHDVFRISTEPTPDDQPTQIPDLIIDANMHLEAGVQYVGARGSDRSDDGPKVDVVLSDMTLSRAPGEPLEHNIPITLAVDGASAGRIVAVGSIDLDSLNAEQPTIKEDITLENLHLAALTTAAAPFAPAVAAYDIAGVVDGTFNADLAANTLAGRITGSQPISVVPREGGQGYETNQFVLSIDGAFSSEALPAEQQVTLEDGTTLTTRQLVNLQRLALETDDGTLTAGAVVDLFLLQSDAMANWPMLARDVTLDVQTDFATAQGRGENLGAFQLSGNADLARAHERFGDLLAAGGAEARQGQVAFTLATQQSADGAVNVPIEVTIDDLVLVQAETPASDPVASAGHYILHQDEPGRISQAPGQQGRISQPPTQPAEPETEPPTQPAGPLRLGHVRLTANAGLTAPRPNAAPGLAGLTANLDVQDAQRQPIVTADLAAAELDAASASAGRVELRSIALPDYNRLQQTLAGWVDLPAAAQAIEPITISAVASYDGAGGAFAVVEPLRVLLAQDELLNVTAAGRRFEDGRIELPDLAATVNVPVADRLASRFSEEPSQNAPATGQLVVRATDAIRVDPANPQSLAGAMEVGLQDVAARGMEVSGALPVRLAGMGAAVPEDAKPLTVNGGTLKLAGARVEQREDGTMPLELPEGELAQDISLNPVLMQFLGKYVNPIFVDPEQAAGFFSAQLTSDGPIDLSNALASANVTLTFSVRDLRVDNDIIAQFADAAVGESVSALRGQLAAIPGLDSQVRQRLQAFSLSEEVREEITSVRGNIADAKVTLRNGVAGTAITFNIADPRASAAEAGNVQHFGLSFTGGVNLETYALQNLSVTVPTALIEKWAGENPNDLVEIFGERPWPKLLPDGVRIGINGTTFVPVPDPASFQAMAREVAPRAAEAAIRGGIEGALQRGLGDLLRRRNGGEE